MEITEPSELNEAAVAYNQIITCPPIMGPTLVKTLTSSSLSSRNAVANNTHKIQPILWMLEGNSGIGVWSIDADL